MDLTEKQISEVIEILLNDERFKSALNDAIESVKFNGIEIKPYWQKTCYNSISYNNDHEIEYCRFCNKNETLISIHTLDHGYVPVCDDCRKSKCVRI